MYHYTLMPRTIFSSFSGFGSTHFICRAYLLRHLTCLEQQASWVWLKATILTQLSDAYKQTKLAFKLLSCDRLNFLTRKVWSYVENISWTNLQLNSKLFGSCSRQMKTSGLQLIKWFQRRNYGLKGTAVLLWLPDGCAWAAFVPGCCPEAEGARRACGCVGARGPSVCGWVVSSGRGRGPGAAGRGLLSFAASPCRCWGPGVTTLQADRNGKVEAVFVSARGKSGQQKKIKIHLFNSSHQLIIYAPK